MSKLLKVVLAWAMGMGMTLGCALAQSQPQNQLVLQTPAAPRVTQASALYQGEPGNQAIYYWIVARYLAGVSQTAGPIVALNTAGVPNLSVTNFVRVVWTGLGNFGATGYDVIRTSTPDYPLASGSCAACAVVVDTSLLSVTDQGGVLSPYTLPGVIGQNTAVVQVDNTSRSSGAFLKLNLLSDYRFVLVNTNVSGCAQWGSDGVTLLGTGANCSVSGSGIAIGDPVTSGTQGSVLFVGLGSTLQQNNSRLFWNDTNGFLGINTTAAPTTELDVRGRFTAANQGTAPESYPSLVNTTRPTTAGQHMTMTRSGLSAVSIGYVPNTSIWGVGPANLTDASFAPTIRLDGSRFTIMDGINLKLEPRAADPGTPANGDIWYNSTTNTFRCRQNGVTVDCITVLEPLAVGDILSGGISNALWYTDAFGQLNNNANYTIEPITNVAGFGVSGSANPLHVRSLAAQTNLLRLDLTGVPNGVGTPYVWADYRASSSALPGTYTSVYTLGPIYTGGVYDYVRMRVASGSLRLGVGNDLFNITANGVGINTTSIEASAVWQADSTSQGVLAPRMTTAQRNAIGSPAEGLMVFDTDLNQPCYYNGSTWDCLTGSATALVPSSPYLLSGSTYYYPPNYDVAVRPEALSRTWVNQQLATEVISNGTVSIQSEYSNTGLNMQDIAMNADQNYFVAYRCTIASNSAVSALAGCFVGYRSSVSGQLSILQIECSGAAAAEIGCETVINNWTSASVFSANVTQYSMGNSFSAITLTNVVRLRYNSGAATWEFSVCNTEANCNLLRTASVFFSSPPNRLAFGVLTPAGGANHLAKIEILSIKNVP